MGADYLINSRKYKGYHYSVLSKEKIDYLHKRTLEMFAAAKEILDNNNISYVVCGGTLLGGCNQGRFIPWDDDIDVCIFEEDYERAADCLIEGLSGDNVIQCTKTDSNYYLGWMKLRDRRSHIYPDAPRFKENGVWVDLYKMIPTTKLDAPVVNAKEALDYLERRFVLGGLTREEYFERIETRRLHQNLADAVATARKQKENEEENYDVYVIRSASAISVKKTGYFPLRHIEFEGLDVTTFHEPEKYLIQHYGSGYREFPPDEMRSVSINGLDLL